LAFKCMFPRGLLPLEGPLAPLEAYGLLGTYTWHALGLNFFALHRLFCVYFYLEYVWATMCGIFCPKFLWGLCIKGPKGAKS